MQNHFRFISPMQNMLPQMPCEEDGILLYPCERLADTAEEFQQHSFSKGIVNITLLPGNYYIINFSLFFHQKGVLELMKKSGSHQDYL